MKEEEDDMDDMDAKAQELINQVTEENKKKEEKKNSRTSGYLSKTSSNGDFNNDINKVKTKNIVINKRRDSLKSNSPSNSDSDSPESSPRGSLDEEKVPDSKNSKNMINNIDKVVNNNLHRSSIVSSDSTLDNLMLSRDINIKAFTLFSCAFCIGTISLSIIGSLILERLLTFNYGQNYISEDTQKKKQAIEGITMNHVMIYILLTALCVFNFGILVMISLNNDKMLTTLIYSDLKWYFVLTQLAFGSLFLISLIWETDLWTINVCLSISMLTILILAFYFTEIKQKKNMSKGTFIFIYAYISCLFSFISYVTLYNISCILMENMEAQHGDVQTISYTIIKVSINAGQTILSFVLLTYFKDVFFAFTSGYIICAVFIHENFNLEKENIGFLVMVLAIVLGIVLTIVRYRKKTFGYEDVPVEITKDIA